MSEIAPCPACGTKAVLCIPVANHSAYVECSHELCRLFGPTRTEPDDAIDAWNRRYAIEQLAAAARAWLAEEDRQMELAIGARLPDHDIVFGNITIGMIRATGGGE